MHIRTTIKFLTTGVAAATLGMASLTASAAT